jgi:hypothetical protein
VSTIQPAGAPASAHPATVFSHLWPIALGLLAAAFAAPWSREDHHCRIHRRPRQRQHGLVLSRRRAAAVAQVLRPNLDKADYPFSVSGRGEADPAVPNTSEKNRRLNRRVEWTYRPA